MQYHCGLSKREHIGQETGDWFLADYGVTQYACRQKMRCYGRPRGWGWSVKDRYDGPKCRSHRQRVRRSMRKRARRESRYFLQELEQELTQ